ncbi:MAG: succinate dehydrogenase [Bacillota bacterium]|jgi:fumarate reductase subunit C
MKNAKVPGHSPRTDLYLEAAGLVTGILLVAFLWIHAFLVAIVVFGPAAFDGTARFLEKHYLSYAGIGLGLLIGLVHVASVARRIPTGYREQRAVWRTAGRMRHTDTYVWAFQAVTGPVILVAAAVHLWVVLADWPLQAAKSALRVQTDYLVFYLILLLVAEYHAAAGIYRLLVKWARFRRRSLAYAVGTAAVFILSVNLAALWALLHLGGVR